MIRLYSFLILLLPYKLYASNEICVPSPILGQAYYVATDGVDYKANGSRLSPWKTIKYALFAIPDGNTLIVKEGVYTESIKIKIK